VRKDRRPVTRVGNGGQVTGEVKEESRHIAPTVIAAGAVAVGVGGFESFYILSTNRDKTDSFNY